MHRSRLTQQPPCSRALTRRLHTSGLWAGRSSLNASGIWSLKARTLRNFFSEESHPGTGQNLCLAYLFPRAHFTLCNAVLTLAFLTGSSPSGLSKPCFCDLEQLIFTDVTVRFVATPGICGL